jgi:hypothetical protein
MLSSPPPSVLLRQQQREYARILQKQISDRGRPVPSPPLFTSVTHRDFDWKTPFERRSWPQPSVAPSFAARLSKLEAQLRDREQTIVEVTGRRDSLTELLLGPMSRSLQEIRASLECPSGVGFNRVFHALEVRLHSTRL